MGKALEIAKSLDEKAEVANGANGEMTRKECFAKGTLKTLASWFREPDEPQVAIWDGLVKKGESFAIVAQQKVGKSHLVAQLCAGIAAGGRVLGRACHQETVYYANAEVGAQSCKDRFRRIVAALGISAQEIEDRLFIDNLANVETDFDEIRAKCKALGATVAVVDPFYMVARIVETDEQSCLDAIEQMQKFKKDGITLGVVVHSPKGFSGDRQLIDQIAGSSFLGRYFGSIIGLLGHASGGKNRVFDCALRDFPAPEPFTVTLESGVFEVADGVPAEVASSRNAWKRNEAKPAFTLETLKPYAVRVLEQAREAAGADFLGLTKGKFANGIKARTIADGLTVGINTIAYMLDLLPKDLVTSREQGNATLYNLAKEADE